MGTRSTDVVREQVRDRYARAARVALGGAPAVGVEVEQQVLGTDGCGCGAGCGCGEAPAGVTEAGAASASCCGDAPAGAAVAFYDEAERDGLPDAALLASLGCGNPLAVAELREGETVLDLGSGGGIDVLLSARRVGPEGHAYGLDMTEEMLELARRNAAEAGAANVTFLRGEIEAIPLPDASVDVVISNCVVNLSTDKAAVLAQTFRVLRPGGRIGITDIVASDSLSPEDRAARGSYAGCIAGALSFSEYRAGLEAAGFGGIEVEPIHQVADGMHSAIVRAIKPPAA